MSLQARIDPGLNCIHGIYGARDCCVPLNVPAPVYALVARLKTSVLLYSSGLSAGAVKGICSFNCHFRVSFRPMGVPGVKEISPDRTIVRKVMSFPERK